MINSNSKEEWRPPPVALRIKSQTSIEQKLCTINKHQTIIEPPSNGYLSIHTSFNYRHTTTGINPQRFAIKEKQEKTFIPLKGSDP